MLHVALLPFTSGYAQNARFTCFTGPIPQTPLYETTTGRPQARAADVNKAKRLEEKVSTGPGGADFPLF